MQSATHSEVLSVGELEIRPGDHLAFVLGRAIPLSVRELDVLAALATREGRKLEPALPGRTFIHTQFGFGYRLAAEPTTNTEG
jgi:hypothetical protein